MISHSLYWRILLEGKKIQQKKKKGDRWWMIEIDNKFMGTFLRDFTIFSALPKTLIAFHTKQ